MTNQEAINKLTAILNDDIYSWSPAILTAFGMAVEALRGEDAQPTQTNTSNTLNALDCIDRQAAIEIVDFECGGELIGTAKIITKRLSDLPPAQPEQPIRCKDCKHHDGIRCFRWNSTIITNFDDFCSNAERKEGEAE